MNKNSIKINVIIPKDTNNVVPVSKGYNYKKLCVIVFVIGFLIFLIISALLSIVGIVFMYHILNEPTSAQLITPTPLPTIMTNRSVFNYSLYPTPLPTFTPSISPSISPTTSPSQSPSISPSQSPSISPSYSPSISPTTLPSILPTINPTTTPSMSPTNSPSYSPIVRSNNNYTIAPTPLLNNYISDNITLSPNGRPTCIPTYISIYDINNNNKTLYTIYNTTVFNSNQFSIIVELLSIICPICLCCVCIHIPLAFVPLCLANKKDKFNNIDKDSRYYKGSIKQTLDTIHHLIISSHTGKRKNKSKKKSIKIHPVKHK